MIYKDDWMAKLKSVILNFYHFKNQAPRTYPAFSHKMFHQKKYWSKIYIYTLTEN